MEQLREDRRAQSGTLRAELLDVVHRDEYIAIETVGHVSLSLAAAFDVCGKGVELLPVYHNNDEAVVFYKSSDFDRSPGCDWESGVMVISESQKNQWSLELISPAAWH